MHLAGGNYKELGEGIQVKHTGLHRHVDERSTLIFDENQYNNKFSFSSEVVSMVCLNCII